MIKADLHLHSKYSDYPGTWLLKAYDSPESFTEPEEIYYQAKSRGMDLVTITDHDDIRGCIELITKHPEDCFISCEVTAYFPEDQCKVHILTYGINQAQYDHMMEIRRDLYALQGYLLEQKIAHSVAHATYDQDGKLNFEHIEKLILLFDVFEVINGGTTELSSCLLHQYLQNLDQLKIETFKAKHKITPASSTPWIKGYTGGSDDHCGLLIGTADTYINACAITPQNRVNFFLDSIRNKATNANGMHGSFAIYATGIFKHIHDYRSARDDKYQKTKMNDFLEMFFVGNEGNWAKRFKKSQSLKFLKRKNSKTHQALHKVLVDVSKDVDQDIASKIPSTFDNITKLHDEMFRSLITAFTKHLPNGDIFKVFNRLATLFPMTLLATPFIGSMQHQVLKKSIKKSLINGASKQYTEKALWFTDTIDDLNGVSITLHQIADFALKNNYNLTLVTCVNEQELSSPLPSNNINFVPIESFTVPGYETQKISFPSMLGMMKRLFNEQPDQIIISTPGPVGLAAILCAKLMDIPIKMVYHTDFAEQFLRMTDEKGLANLIDLSVNSVYKLADHIFVPSEAYINRLTQAGMDNSKLSIFPRGIDLDLYRPLETSDNKSHPVKTLSGKFTLMFAGRISEDKNLSLLSKIYTSLEQGKSGLYNLVIAGDGPDLDSLKSKLEHFKNVLFTDRVDAKELVTYYQHSDLLVFPSHTDTFGMVVLEAQACGMPALVTASGGPKEIIINGETGNVIHTDLTADWIMKIEQYYYLKEHKPVYFNKLKLNCFSHIHKQNNWQPVFDQVLGEQCRYINKATDQPNHIAPQPSTDIAA